MTWLLLLLAAASHAPLAQAAEVRASDEGMKVSDVKEGKFKGHQYGNQSFILDNGLVRYVLSYHAYVDPSLGDKVLQDDEGYLGLPGPTSCNWYAGGFLFIRVNGRDIGDVRPSSIRTVENGERGMAQVLWPAPEGQVRFRFLLEPGSDYLACEVAAQPAKDLKDLSLTFRCYPSFFTGWFKRDGWRQVTGPAALVEQGKTADVDPARDSWLLYQDTVFDVAKNPKDSEGPCALLYLPEQVQSVRVAPSSYPVTTDLTVKPAAGKVRFAVWEFPKKTNADALQRMRSGAAAVLERLRGLEFTDRSVAHFDVAKERADLEAQLARASEAAGFRKTVAPLLDQIATALAARQGGDLAAEDRASQLIAQYREASWDLKFDALLSD